VRGSDGEPPTSHVSAITGPNRAHARGWRTFVPSEPRSHYPWPPCTDQIMSQPGRAVWPWADEKLALHKLRVHPDSVARFSPPCEGGAGGVVPAKPGPGTRFRGGWTPRNCRLGRRCWLCPVHPPDPPFARGGKGSLARAVIRSRATKTRVSKPSLQHGQHQLFTGPDSAPGPADVLLDSVAALRHSRSPFTAVK